ncbi:hypothetical protein [Chamaesiphon sp. OTE_8_metabat_110]|uniref:hypothetical protein n=1 Tax=Chamaesiphon sp. OTE_8_metabat_110 TaxID=2964696 RepID=UPI00286D40C4|nr:hypothetical protein [Chamaesiphon sp. OTE_8_metabat_110]
MRRAHASVSRRFSATRQCHRSRWQRQLLHEPALPTINIQVVLRSRTFFMKEMRMLIVG